MSETISRRRSFAQVPDELALDLRLSHLAFRVWVRLDKYAGKDGHAFPSRQRLANDLGVSKGGIARALIELTRTGWITRRPGSAGGVWHTSLNEAPTTPFVREPVESDPADPDSHASRPDSNMSRPPTHMRVPEGDPLKETQISDRSSGLGTPVGVKRKRSTARRKPAKLTSDQLTEQWAMLSDLCRQEGHDDPTSVWWTLRLEHNASRPGAFMADLIDKGTWHGFVGSHGIGEYNRDGTPA